MEGAGKLWESTGKAPRGSGNLRTSLPRSCGIVRGQLWEREAKGVHGSGASMPTPIVRAKGGNGRILVTVCSRAVM
jgi:hypothetical protein